MGSAFVMVHHRGRYGGSHGVRSAGGRGGAEDVGEGGISLSVAVTATAAGGMTVLRVVGSRPGVLVIVGHDGGGRTAGVESGRVLLLLV